MTIAIVCVLIAGLLPYLAFSFVKGVEARTPRADVEALTGRSARAHAAHLNAFETFPYFAAAVLAAHVAGGPSRLADALAVVYILVRLGHLLAYLADRQPLRSSAWGLGQLIAIAIFLSPLIR